jgi:hypothetical protein
LNQVERWFGFLTDQMIRRGAYKSEAYAKPPSIQDLFLATGERALVRP